MTLQFNPQAYEAAYNRGQENENYNRQHPFDVLSQIAERTNQMAAQKRQEGMQKLLYQDYLPSGPLNFNSSNRKSAPVSDSSWQQEGDVSQIPQVPSPVPQATIQPGMDTDRAPLVSSFRNFVSGNAPTQMAAAGQPDYEQTNRERLRMILENPNLSLHQKQSYSTMFKPLMEKQMNPTQMQNYTPDQVKAIYSGDVEKLGAAFPSGIPKEAITKPAQTSMANLDYSQASAQDQQMAKAVQEGRIRPADISFRDRGRIVGLAQDYATKNSLPFESYSGDVKRGMAENLAYGKTGLNSLSLNTALGHVNDALNAYENVGNTNQNWLNVPINKLRTMTNDGNVVALGLNLNALQGELANVFKNSGGTDQEISKWGQYLNENLTPAQFQAAGQKIGELLRSRLSAIEYQQGNVMNQDVTQRQLLSPKGANVMRRLENPSQNGPQPGDIEDGYVFLGGDLSNPKSWRKQ